ncbi:MAG: nitrogen regulation protein NR(I) [Halofilum sp. (in: g-proteobacteria)]|nr:nitrogen regulation protein NR(I) [Halofilum sp. (in: g-proteobacteria)]
MTHEVWLADDDPSMLWVLERALGRAGFTVRAFESGDTLLDALARATPATVITDVRMPGSDGLSVAAHLQREQPDLPVVIMTAHSDLDTTVAAFEHGAFDYLAKPFDLDEAIELVRRACEIGEARTGNDTEEVAAAAGTLVGQSPAMQGLFRAIGRLARTPITVLITGESGTGKERVAQALHQHSPRARRPFVALNMAAIPRELLESELFGHEKGAFTGADSRRAGRFEQADGGTLFLDEIGDMPAELQTRLLRVLSEGRFYRVGGSTACEVDVRIVAATHQDLEARVARGDFREDLYHRLNVVQLPVPPLRDRVEDIPLLAGYFLEQAAREVGVAPKRLSTAVSERLQQLAWPGNVRQLENLCRWLTVMASGHEIRPADLPPEMQQAAAAPSDGGWQQALDRWARERIERGAEDIAGTAQRALERTLIERALAHTNGHRQQAARLLGWGRNTLTRKMKELKLTGDS